MNYSTTSYELRLDFVRTSPRLRTNSASTSYELRFNFVRTSLQLRTNFAPTSYELRLNFVRTSLQLRTNFASTSGEVREERTSHENIIFAPTVCLSASALCKTVHTLRKSYHIGRCVFGTLAAVRRTTLRSRPCVRYGRRRQFS